MNLFEYITSQDLTALVWGNTLESYIGAVGIFVATFLILKALEWIVLYRLAQLAEKTATDIDDTLIRIVKSLRPPFYYFIAFFIATQSLVFHTLVSTIISGIVIGWIIYQIIIALQILVDYVVEKRIQKEDDLDGEAAIHLLGNIAKWVLWAIGALMVLSNLGVNVTSLIAGLGIGGIAIALALQNVLGDLFSSFSIYFDKPFKVGDFIVVGEHSGIVQKIGIKSTRIKALQGEEIVMSNQELTTARVQNFKKLQERRIAFTFGVLYETSSETLKKIPSLVAVVFKNINDVRLDRVHLMTFGASSLDFEVVYYVHSSEYGVYADRQQEINFALFDLFKKEGISFAYPTQTIYLEKG